jgi:DNA-binding NtrC family response regulator
MARKPPKGSVNVLLVDDEIPFVETVTKRLSKKGITISKAFSGEEALMQLERNAALEIVILDVKMPGMDGLAILAEIKRHYPEVEVIILTGHGTFETAVKGMRLGAFDYLNKPCELEELTNRIQEAIQKKGGGKGGRFSDSPRRR